MLKLTTLPLAGGAMCPVIIDDGTDLVLLDCGTPDSYEELCATAQLKGIDLARLTKIIITHHDIDHLGGLPALKALAPGARVIASAIEAEYIERTKKSFRVIAMEQRLETLSGPEREELQSRINGAAAFPGVSVDAKVTGGEVFDWAGGLQIVASPGHMPGHISVYVRELKTLVTGDAMNVRNSMLQNANPQFTLDMDEAVNSIEKFMAYDCAQVICYHGGVFTGDARAAMAAIVEGYRAGQ